MRSSNYTRTSHLMALFAERCTSRRFRAVQSAEVIKQVLGRCLWAGGPDRLKEVILMNKTELVEFIATQADISKAKAGAAVDAFVEAVTASLKKGKDVAIVGFGTFTVAERAARTGRNPQTGETIEIAAAKAPKFRAGKSLKDAVN